MSEQGGMEEEDTGGVDIAVVGMACRFPGADSPEAYWDNLRSGHESLTTLDDEQLLAAGVSAAELADPDYVKAGMFLQNLDSFDAGFFGFSPREAAIMDPQHRIFLETCWEAVENAGHNTDTFAGPVGVFAGSGHNAYLPYNLLSNPELAEDVGFFLLRHTGNDKDFLTTRVSYCLNLKGPSLAVQTACSTSLVSAHLAAQSLVRYECDMALAGGVTIEYPRQQGYLYKENEILSPDGHCRPFDENANGTVFGNGAGVLVLRRLEDALEGGDKIHAVIRSSAVNNDGIGKVSYLAPSVEGQAAAVEEALGIADIDPASVTYVECHGTATKMGDPIEVEALKQAYGQVDRAPQSCALGSVKSNIGHLDTAAGAASLIKVIQSLKHRQIPPTLHFQSPNPAIDLERTPFFINAELKDWHSDSPRRAGVSSLGVGGTNAHMIVEQAPHQESGESRQQQLLVLSARSPQALKSACTRYAEYLQNTDEPLPDVAYTATVGRKAFAHRCCVAGATHEEIRTALQTNDKDKLFFEQSPETSVDIAFMFAGGGAQYPNMGYDLYQQEPVYREALDQCLSAASKVVDFDLAQLLFPDASQIEQVTKELERPSRALPALLSSQYAQAKLWQSFGVSAKAYIGHSMGEYTAACLAGVFSLNDAMAIVAKRGELFEQLEPGGMLSVMLPEKELIEKIGTNSDISIAAVNGPELCVASGPTAAIAAFNQLLEQQDVACQRIHISVAAHSTMVEPVLEEFRQFLQSVSFQNPTAPVVSNLTGTWLTGEQACDPDYWVKHLRQTVRFYAGLDLLLASSDRQALLEVGPGKTLVSAARQHPDVGKNTTAFSSMRHVKQSGDDQAVMLTTLGRLWGCGAVDDLSVLFEDQQRLRVELPTYPFEHQPYWIEPGKLTAKGGKAERRSIDKWCFQPSWQPASAPQSVFEGKQLIVLLGDEDTPLWKPLVSSLEAAQVELVQVKKSSSFEHNSPGHFSLDPESKDDYQALFAAIHSQDFERVCVLHGWSYGESQTCESQTSLKGSFHSLLALAQAINEQLWQESMLCVASSGSLSIGPGDLISNPMAATMLGACRVLSKEIENLTVRYIDTDSHQADEHENSRHDWVPARTGQALAKELVANELPLTQAIAYRQGQRYQEDYREVELTTSPMPLKSEGCYLISGGLGGLGLEMAQEMVAQEPGIRLVLLGRSALPPRESWPSVLEGKSRDATRIRAVLALEAEGATVTAVAVDVCDSRALGSVVESMTATLGPVRGVVHTAGVIQDNLLALKTRSEVESVLAPKVQGTLALADCTAHQPLDFFILFSSTSAIAGIAGQIDYAAANAFMDSYAHYRRIQDGLPIVSVNWSAWQQVGMAAELAAGSRIEGLRFESFKAQFKNNSYRRCLSTTDWLLNEHRTKAGTALVPGTGFLEIMSTAAQSSQLFDSGKIIELQDVFFLSPLIVRDGEQRVVDVAFSTENTTNFSANDTNACTTRPSGVAFSLKSALDPDTADSDLWLSEHVQGQVAMVSKPASAVQKNMNALISRCNARVINQAGSAEHDHMDFGDRWQCLQTVYCGDDEAVAELVLPQAFDTDLNQAALHPALLDMITAAGFHLTPDYRPENDFFVPVSYGRVTLYQPMQGHVMSHITLKKSGDGDKSCFDFQVYSSDGTLLVDVTDFVAKRMQHDVLDSDPVQSQADSALQQELVAAIKPAEGRTLFANIMMQRQYSQLVVSPTDFRHRFIQSGLPPEISEQPQGTMELERPDTLSGYVAPATDSEKKLAELWQTALGIGQVGVDDNFFELGGHSLMLTQLVGKAKKLMGIQLPLSQLFDKPTIKNWLELSAAGVSVEAKPSMSSLKRVSRDAYQHGRQ